MGRINICLQHPSRLYLSLLDAEKNHDSLRVVCVQVHSAEAPVQHSGDGQGRSPAGCRFSAVLPNNPRAHCPGPDPAHQSPCAGLCQPEGLQAAVSPMNVFW